MERSKLELGSLLILIGNVNIIIIIKNSFMTQYKFSM